MADIDYSERSSRAAHNGKCFEEKIKCLLPEVEHCPDGVVDFYFLGAPLEAKSCQVNVIDNTQKGPHVKSGRFFIRDYQHEYLVKNRGRYLLGVMDGERIVRTRLVLADRLLPEFEGKKTLTWKTVFRALGVAC